MPEVSRSSLTVDLGPRSYAVHFAPLAALPAAMTAAGLRAGRCLVVTDRNVAARHLETLTAALRGADRQPHVVTLEPGEGSKRPEPLQHVYDEALAWGVDRGTPLLAFGGGVVGDLAGFAAATLLRGLPLVQVPTTCIAQVDSALGGKTGINHAAGKNLVGAFYQPRLVHADPALLQTLPEREWTSGLAEVVKHALIDDVDLMQMLTDRWHAVAVRDRDLLPGLMHRAAAVKARIVAEDEREEGRRAVLNFGHTFGHAVERVAGYGVFTHGEAVALGMRAALHLSRTLRPEFDVTAALALVDRLPLPAPLPELDVDALMRAMRTDKKVRDGDVHFVLLRRPGEAYVTGGVDPEAVRHAWKFALERRLH